MSGVIRFLYKASMVVVIAIMILIFLLFASILLNKFPPALFNLVVTVSIVLFFYGAYKFHLTGSTHIWTLVFVILIPIVIVFAPLYIIVPPASIMADEMFMDENNLPDFDTILSMATLQWKNYNDYFSLNHLSVLISETWALLLVLFIYFYGSYRIMKARKEEIQSINKGL